MLEKLNNTVQMTSTVINSVLYFNCVCTSSTAPKPPNELSWRFPATGMSYTLSQTFSLTELPPSSNTHTTT